MQASIKIRVCTAIESLRGDTGVIQLPLQQGGHLRASDRTAAWLEGGMHMGKPTM